VLSSQVLALLSNPGHLLSGRLVELPATVLATKPGPPPHALAAIHVAQQLLLAKHQGEDQAACLHAHRDDGQGVGGGVRLVFCAVALAAVLVARRWGSKLSGAAALRGIASSIASS
jgi:hypothetical protein